MVVDLKNEALGAFNVHKELWQSWNSYTFKNMISSTLLSIKYKKEESYILSYKQSKLLFPCMQQ